MVLLTTTNLFPPPSAMNPPHDLTDKMLILNKTAPRYSELYSQTETTLCVVYLITASVIGLVMNFALIIATLNYKANKLGRSTNYLFLSFFFFFHKTIHNPGIIFFVIATSQE